MNKHPPSRLYRAVNKFYGVVKNALDVLLFGVLEEICKIGEVFGVVVSAYVPSAVDDVSYAVFM